MFAKAKLLYDYLDASSFFRSPVRKQDRSRMNVPFTLAKDSLNDAFMRERSRGPMHPWTTQTA